MHLFDALYANSIHVMLSKGKNALIPIKLQHINSPVDLFGSLEEFMEVLVDERERERDRRRRRQWRRCNLMILDNACH